MDKETNKILTEQQLLRELLNHQGWGIARRNLSDKILALQNAFDIDDTDPAVTFRDLQARKKASEILFDWLRELESSKDVIEENTTESNRSHIVTLD